MSEPTILTCLDGFDRLKSRLSFLDLACHSTRLQEVLEEREYDGLLWFLDDFQEDFDRLIAALHTVVTSLIVAACLVCVVTLPAVAQTSSSITQDKDLVSITLPGNLTLEQLNAIRLINKDVLTILEQQLNHEETKVNHAETVNAAFWYACLMTPLLAFAWLLYKMKKLHVQHTQQQTLFIDSRSSLPGQQPLVMLPTAQALQRRV